MITKRVKNNALIDLSVNELKQIGKISLITALATILILHSSKSFAVNCTNEEQCFSKATTLIKQAVKLGAKDKRSYCNSEIKALYSEVSKKAIVGSPAYEALETCMAHAKDNEKLAKKAVKRQERLLKALKADS